MNTNRNKRNKKRWESNREKENSEIFIFIEKPGFMKCVNLVCIRLSVSLCGDIDTCVTSNNIQHCICEQQTISNRWPKVTPYFWKVYSVISSELDEHNNHFQSDLSHVYMWVHIKIKDETQYEYITWIEQMLFSETNTNTDLNHLLESLP